MPAPQNKKIWVCKPPHNGFKIARIKCVNCGETLAHWRNDYGAAVNCPRCNYAFTLRKSSLAKEFAIILACMLVFFAILFAALFWLGRIGKKMQDDALRKIRGHSSVTQFDRIG